MKLFDRLLFRETFWVFVFAVVLFVGIVWLGFGPIAATLKYISMGISAGLIVKIALLNIPPIFAYAFPISMLLATVFTFVRLSESSEAVAFFAGGISLYQMLLPTAGVAVCVTIVGLVINNSIVPYAVKQVTDFKENISREIKPTNQSFGLPPVRDGEGRLLATVWVEGGFDIHRNAMQEVTINEYDPKTGAPAVTVFARSAQWQGGNNWLLNGVTVLGIGSENQAIAGATREIRATPEELASFQVDPDTLNFSQLARRIGQMRAAGAPEVLSDETNLWNKIALPLASLIFAMVGAPLGLRPQRGYSRALAFAGGFALIAAYYTLNQYLQILSAGGKVDPFLAAFLPDLLGVLVAAYLIGRAPT